MIPIIEAALFTSFIFTANLILKNKIKPSRYIFLFIAFWIAAFAFGSRLHAQVPNAKQEIELARLFIKRASLDKEDRKYYQDKVRFHFENAERTYRDAKNKCWWLPDISDREAAKYCFTTAASYFTSSDPRSKIIAMTAQLLIQYGLDCLDEWSYIKNKLHWSEYHYEMMEFYQDVLRETCISF